jgi:hypothetical protein
VELLGFLVGGATALARVSPYPWGPGLYFSPDLAAMLEDTGRAEDRELMLLAQVDASRVQQGLAGDPLAPVDLPAAGTLLLRGKFDVQNALGARGTAGGSAVGHNLGGGQLPVLTGVVSALRATTYLVRDQSIVQWKYLLQFAPAGGAAAAPPDKVLAVEAPTTTQSAQIVVGDAPTLPLKLEVSPPTPVPAVEAAAATASSEAVSTAPSAEGAGAALSTGVVLPKLEAASAAPASVAKERLVDEDDDDTPLGLLAQTVTGTRDARLLDPKAASPKQLSASSEGVSAALSSARGEHGEHQAAKSSKDVVSSAKASPAPSAKSEPTKEEKTPQLSRASVADDNKATAPSSSSKPSVSLP